MSSDSSPFSLTGNRNGGSNWSLLNEHDSSSPFTLGDSSYDFGISSNDPAFVSAVPTSGTASQFFGVTSGSDLRDNLSSNPSKSWSQLFEGKKPDPRSTVGELALDIGGKLIPVVGEVKKAASLGKELYESSKAIQESQRPPTEAILCQAAKVAAKTAAEEIGTGLILEGTLAVLGETAAFPPSAIVTIPVLAATVPQAYTNVKEAAEFAGQKAEEDCHRLFSGKQ